MPAIGNRPTGNAHHNRETCTCPPCVNSRRKSAVNSPPAPPNAKQEKLAEIVVNKLAEGQPVSAKEAMAEAGYSARAIANPDKVFETESMRACFLKWAGKKKLDPRLLAVVHRGLLTATRSIYMKDGDGNIVKFEEPDNLARTKALDMAYNVLDIYPHEEKREGALVIIHSSAILTPGHQKHCRCPSCTEALERFAQKCREQVSRVPEEYQEEEEQKHREEPSLNTAPEYGKQGAVESASGDGLCEARRRLFPGQDATHRCVLARGHQGRHRDHTGYWFRLEEPEKK